MRRKPLTPRRRGSRIVLRWLTAQTGLDPREDDMQKPRTSDRQRTAHRVRFCRSFGIILSQVQRRALPVLFGVKT